MTDAVYFLCKQKLPLHNHDESIVCINRVGNHLKFIILIYQYNCKVSK
jgi:hypothetical protein